ncbi:MAG TPA: Rne/Rng family ribonuclease [Acidimicrobiales bacterium]|nr:Rne/Rng family ribonuclease [Acidimicrobiales bacterium]
MEPAENGTDASPPTSEPSPAQAKPSPGDGKDSADRTTANGASAGNAGGGQNRGRRRRGSRGGRRRSGRAPASEAGRTDAPEFPPAKPKIGDTRPAPQVAAAASPEGQRKRKRPATRSAAVAGDSESAEERRRGQERNGRPLGRYMMCVQVRPNATQIAVMEGRALIEHYVSRPSDDSNQIDGNIYLGRVQNVLPGMEAAFVDIGTPKNAVLYRGDVRYDADDVQEGRGRPTARIEEMLKPGQTIVCQVTKNPIGTKGARLTQEVSMPGRFVVLIPHSDSYGISKRLDDEERRRLRRVLDEVRPEGHGLIVRTAAEAASAEELRRDVAMLVGRWEAIEKQAQRARVPSLLYREPDMAVRIIREEFNRHYRGVVIDDADLYAEVRDYVEGISPELADRVELYPPDETLPVFERYHVHEQLHKALDRKVWLPSGGSLIIERTEALTVIDVNTGKNVGTSNLEETVYRNNLEAAEEVARQLRLRDIGGIIVIDFIDMEIKANRDSVMSAFRSALARDKTRTQVFDISELGLVEMTRKRVGEGLLASFSDTCPMCKGRGIVVDESLL